MTQGQVDALNAKIATLHQAGDTKAVDSFFLSETEVGELITEKTNPNSESEEDTKKKD